MTVSRYKSMLTIAGSDPSGGAGIQADIKTATALGVYAMSVLTAVTAQNTLGVRGFEPVSLPLLEAQLDCVISDIRPDAVKIGMVPSAAHIRVIAEALRRHELTNIVLDPVLVATSGDALSEGDTVQALLAELAPLCEVITPNIPETQALTGLPTDNMLQITEAGYTLLRSGARSVLVKGGHGDSADEIIDLYLSADRQSQNLHSRIDTPNTHGTGCTLSSAIASFLALGAEGEEAVCRGIEWLHGAIKAGAHYQTGHGHGPVNHLYTIQSK